MIKLSPAVKIILYILLICAAFSSNACKIDAVLLMLVSFSAVHVPFRVLRRGIIPIAVLLFFTFFSTILFQTGKVLYEIRGITVTEEGLRNGVHLTLRLFILILGAKVLSATTSPGDLVEALVRLLGPLGKWKHLRDFMLTLTLTLRFLPMIYEEAKMLYKETVQNTPAVTFKDRIGLSVSLISPLFERSMKKARDLSKT